MERNQRRDGRPGREHRPESSRRPYSDEQETYRNPRNENYDYREGGTGHGNRRFDEDYTGRGPKNYSRSDERIKEDICDELSSDPECDAGDVEIEVKDGRVNLSGTVPSRKMKHRAEDIADAARGVKDVDNRIRVTGRIGQGQHGSFRGSEQVQVQRKRRYGLVERSLAQERIAAVIQVVTKSR